MAETKKTTETKAVKSSETKAEAKAPAAKKTTATKAAASKAAPKAETKTTTAKKTTTTKAEAPKAEVKAVEVKETAVKVAPKAKAQVDMIKVTLVKSGSGRLLKQKRTLEALGLRKTNSSNIVPDNAATRGMIFVVKHLVSVEKV